MVETLAGQCGQPGFKDGGGREALFSASVWDAACAPRDCSVIMSDPSNHALRRVQLPAGSCAAGGTAGGHGAGASAILRDADLNRWSSTQAPQRAEHGHCSTVLFDSISFAFV